MALIALQNYEDTRVVEHCATAEFRAVLSTHGRRAPAFLRSKVEQVDYRHAMRFTVEFSAGAQIDWEIETHRLTRQGQRDVLHPALELELRRLYSRLYEDHLIELDLRVARQNFRDVVSVSVDPAAVDAARQLFDAQCEMIRQSHRGFASHMLASGVDLAALGSDHTVIAGITRDGQSIMERRPGDLPLTVQQMDYTISNVVAEVAERPELTTTMVREIIERMQLLTPNPAEYFDAIAFGTFSDVGSKKANAKGMKLLKSWLTPAQLAQYKKDKCFEVIGCDSGKRYRIRHGRQMNIDELDKDGKKACGWCFLPEGQLVAGDCMLAQKIALETDETAALKIANRFGDAHIGTSYYRGDLYSEIINYRGL